MKIKDLIRGYFDNSLRAERVTEALAAVPSASARRFLRIIETDQQARRVLADFGPEKGAAERLSEFVAGQSVTVLANQTKKSRGWRPSTAALQFEVVGFQKSGAGDGRAAKSRRRKPRAKRSRKRS